MTPIKFELIVERLRSFILEKQFDFYMRSIQLFLKTNLKKQF
jgi:hypothetical protein